MLREPKLDVKKEQNRKYWLEQFDRNFIGDTPEEIYKEVFEVKEKDERFLELSKQTEEIDKLKNRIEEMEKKDQTNGLSDGEKTELNQTYKKYFWLLKVVKTN